MLFGKKKEKMDITEFCRQYFVGSYDYEPFRGYVWSIGRRGQGEKTYKQWVNLVSEWKKK